MRPSSLLILVAFLGSAAWTAVAQNPEPPSDIEAKEFALRLAPQQAVLVLQKRAIELRAAGNKDQLADTLQLLARNLGYMRKFDEADKTYEELVTLQQEGGKEGYKSAIILTDWAQRLVFVPNVEKAETLLKRALPILEASAGVDGRDTLEALEGLESVCVAQSKWSEAEALRKRIFAATERKFGPSSREMAIVWRNAAASLKTEKRNAEAVKLAQQSVEWFENAKLAKTIDASQAYNVLGMTYMGVNRYAEAEGAMHKALEIAELNYGKDDIRLGAVINNLALTIDTVADIQNDKKRRDEAESMYRKSLAISERVFGSSHPEVAISLNNVASILKSKSNHTEAEQLYRRAVAIQDAGLPKNSPTRITTKINLLEAIRALGRVKEAETMSEAMLAEVEGSFGKQSATYAEVLHTRGSLLARLNRPEEAEQSFWEAMKVREKALGPDHVDVARSLNNVALLVELRGDHKNPESMFRRVLSINEKHYGKDAIEIFGDLINLAENLQSQDRLGEAQVQFKRALTIFEKGHGGENDNLGEWLRGYSQLLRKDKKLEEAEVQLRRAVVIHKKALGETHPRTGTSLWWLASLLREREKLMEAEKLARQGYIIMSNQTGAEKVNDETLGAFRDLYMLILSELHYPRNLALDRLDLMRNGSDPGQLPGSST